jgi:hypothetical protein
MERTKRTVRPAARKDRRLENCARRYPERKEKRKADQGDDTEKKQGQRVKNTIGYFDSRKTWGKI